jgi:hypothetical protein
MNKQNKCHGLQLSNLLDERFNFLQYFIGFKMNNNEPGSGSVDKAFVASHPSTVVRVGENSSTLKLLFVFSKATSFSAEGKQPCAKKPTIGRLFEYK